LGGLHLKARPSKKFKKIPISTNKPGMVVSTYLAKQEEDHNSRPAQYKNARPYMKNN
jgi:hypothetical protein